MDINKFLEKKGLEADCFIESDMYVSDYVQYEVRDLIKEAINEQLRLYSVSRSLPSWQEIMLEGEQEANKRHLDNTNLSKIHFLQGWRLACKYLGRYYIKR